MNTNNLPKASQSHVIALVEQWFRAGKMFTKYDVTKQLRHDGFHIRHAVVRNAINSMEIADDYDTQLIRVNNRPVFVYYPEDADSSDYDPGEVTEFAIRKDDVNVVNDVGSKGGILKAKIKSMFDTRGRFSVSAHHVRDAGFSPGNHVAIKANAGKIEIQAATGNDNTVTVDCYLNIRISKRAFENAFDSLPKEIEIEIKKGKIEIKEV